MNKNETFGIVAREYLARNGYGLQLHDIDKEVDSVILAAQQSDKEEKLNSAEKEEAVSPSGKPTNKGQNVIPIVGSDLCLVPVNKPE